MRRLCWLECRTLAGRRDRESRGFSFASGEKPAALPAVKQLTEAKKIVIDYPSAQTHIFVGQPGTKRGDKDYFTLYVANHPFGGSGFTSRLVNVIREDKGLAYSVYSYFSPMRQLGAFAMGMQTKTDQTEQALTLLNQQLKKYTLQKVRKKMSWRRA